jgi:hypothetical protein
MPFALFGITNDGLNLAVNLLILFLVVVYIALIAWTYMDARRRLNDQVLVGAATVGSLLFPFVGTIVYSILRPPEFLDDKHERELEIRTSELRVRQLQEASCQNCGFPIERTYMRCPSCRTRVKDPCETCGKPVDPRWSICPYCETPAKRAAAAQAASPRRRPRAAAGAPRRLKPPEGGRPGPPPAQRKKAPPARPSSSQRPPRPRSGSGKPRPASRGEGRPAQPPAADGTAGEEKPASAPEERPRPAKT